jgi:hypothetical protein
LEAVLEHLVGAIDVTEDGVEVRPALLEAVEAGVEGHDEELGYMGLGEICGHAGILDLLKQVEEAGLVLARVLMGLESHGDDDDGHLGDPCWSWHSAT